MTVERLPCFILKMAVAQLCWSKPRKEVKLLKEPKGRLRYLDQEEVKLLSAAKEPLWTTILVGVYRGLRFQARALTLKWEDIDFRRGPLTVRAAYAKSGESRAVNFNSTLKAAFKPLEERSRGEYVFSKPDDSPYKSIRLAFKTACKHAKLSGVTPHTLRHPSQAGWRWREWLGGSRNLAGGETSICYKDTLI